MIILLIIYILIIFKGTNRSINIDLFYDVIHVIAQQNQYKIKKKMNNQLVTK